jgi:hypothetical protein
MEFYNALRKHFGFRGSMAVSDEAFSSLDGDKSGQISYDELYEFVKGRRNSLDKRHKRIRDLRLEPPRGTTLEHVAWDSAVLRSELLKAMKRCNVGSTDMINIWDSNRNAELEEREFCTNLRKLFKGHEPLWKSIIEPIAKTTFFSVCTKAGDSKVVEAKMSVTELEVWLRATPHDSLYQPPPLLDRPFSTEKMAAEAAKKAAKESAKKTSHSPNRQRPTAHHEKSQPPGKPRHHFEDVLASPILCALLLKKETPGTLRSTSALVRPRTQPVERVDHMTTLLRDHAFFWNGARVTRPLRTARGRTRDKRLPPIHVRTL